MRKSHLMGLVVLALSIGLVGTVVAGVPEQTLDASMVKNKLDKKKKSKNGVIVKIDNATREPAGRPAKGLQTQVFFTKNMAFNTKSVKLCKTSLEGITTAAAKAACGKSQVSVDGPGSVAGIQFNGGTEFSDGVVTAFNGPKKNQVTLHSRFDSLGATTILVGKLKKASGSYGSKLVVPIPEVASGAAAIKFFYTIVKKGKYVVGNCKDKTPDFKETTKFTPDEELSPFTAKDTSKCKRK